MRPAQRRQFVRWAQEAYRVSERRACLAAGVARSSVRYRSVRPSQEPLRRRIREICAVRVRAGYRQVHVLLRREGWQINHKRTYRLYREEGLTQRTQRKRRHRSAARRIQRDHPKRHGLHARHAGRRAVTACADDDRHSHARVPGSTSVEILHRCVRCADPRARWPPDRRWECPPR